MQPLIPFFDRVSFTVGPLVMGGFGLMVASGLVVGCLMSARKLRSHGLDPGVMLEIGGLVAIGVYVGGHLGHVFWYEPEILAGEGRLFAQFFGALFSGSLPTQDQIPILLRFGDGLSSFGGFLVCALLVIAFLRRRGLDVLLHADAVAYGLVFGWAIARVGCFMAHDHPGTVTTFWLGVRGNCPGAYGVASLACHDLGLYEALWSAGVGAYFLYADRRPKPVGFYLGTLCAFYGPTRFALDFLRHPGIDARYAGLTPAQYGSIVLFVVGIAVLRRSRLATS